MKTQIIKKLFLILFCLSMMIASAKATIKKGVDYYNNRHENSDSIKASNKNINIAINYFLNAIKISEYEKDAALYLLKSYYYKGEFTTSNSEEKKLIFNKGKILGKKYIDKFPNSVEFRYWYLVNLGSWAQVYGIITAAREGVADQMKNHSEIIINLDPTYQNGGGYFMLGAVHYKSPYIPFLLPWPDNDEAIKYLQLAHNTGIATLNQKNYLAQAIYKNGNHEKATKLLNEVVNTEPNTNELVEDLDKIQKAHQLLKDF